jgi:hypothetical protein
MRRRRCGTHPDHERREGQDEAPPPTLTIPKATRDFVWARDQGRCRVPGCRATRHLTFHHLRFLCEGGDHDPANLVLICDGHHKVLHERLLTITGRAPDDLTFIRDGKRLVDARSTVEHDATTTLRADTTHARAAHSSDLRVTTRNRFEDVMTFEHAKQALMQLGYKARAARAALDDACAHVGGGADVAMLVKTVLARQHQGLGGPTSDEDVQSDATKAITQLGYPHAIARAAVAAASAHVGASAELATLIKEALRRCGSS